MDGQRELGAVVLRASRRDDEGATAVLFALVSLMLMLVAGYVVDLAMVRDQGLRAQTAADAAALAAGNELYPASGIVANTSGAIAAAKRYAAANMGITQADWADCSDPGHLTNTAPDTPCISFRINADYSHVRVLLPETELSTPFGQLFRSDTFDGTHRVAALAQSVIRTGGRFRCVLCVLGTQTHDIQNGGVRVTGGDVHFNGNTTLSNNGFLRADNAVTIEGTALGAGYTPTPLTNQPRVADPLASMDMPPSMTGLVPRSNPCTQGPGIYGAFSFNNMTCALKPGLYVIAGATWNLAGNTNTRVTGTGVTLYATCGTAAAIRACAAGEAGGSVDLTGNGSVSITAPTIGAQAGLAVIYDRRNAASLRLNGNGNAQVTGTFYAVSAALEMGGNGCLQAYRSLMIVQRLNLNGNGACFSSVYEPTENVRLPAVNLHLSR